MPFRSSAASTHERRAPSPSAAAGGGAGADRAADVDAMMAINRRERARIFARMFAPSSSASASSSSSSSFVPFRAPPDRGANVVVTIRRDYSRCARLQKALYLLGTYYNLFVIVDVSSRVEASSSSESSESCPVDESEMRGFVARVRSELR